MKYLIIYLFTMVNVLANFPPTTVKSQNDTVKQTTFNLEAPNYQATSLNGTTKLIETGNNNVIKDPSFEGNSLEWVTYADAAGTAPVDGTGGTANVTIAYTTTNPLNGKKSMLFTKDAANRQGQGTSLNFTIPDINKGKVNNIKISYDIVSGTYATGDLTMWVINVDPASATNGRVIQPSAYTIENSGLKESKFLEFQSDIDSNLYRLIIHVASTSNNAYSLRFDDVSVGLGPKIYGSVATDWELVSSGASVSWTNSNLTLYKRRVGDSVEYQGKIVFTGTPSGTGLYITLPHSIDLTKMQTPDYGDLAYMVDSGTMDYTAVGGYSTANIYYFFQISNASPLRTYNGITPTSPFSFTNGDYIIFKIPPKKVVGWSSSQQLSQDADTRVVTARVNRSAAQSIPNASVTKVQFDSILFDRASGWDNTNYRYVAKVAGDYEVYSQLQYATNTTGIRGVRIFKNGVEFVSSQSQPISTGNSSQANVKDIVPLNAGDYVEIFAYQESGGSLSINAGVNTYISIQRISGPSQIASSETVSASYQTSSAQSIPNASSVTVLFNTKIYDSHNSYNTSTGAFTAPISGKYLICGLITYLSSVGTTGNLFNIWIYKNGSPLHRKIVPQIATGSVMAISVDNCKTVQLLQGETASIVTNHDESTAKSLNNQATLNSMSIDRIGNY